MLRHDVGCVRGFVGHKARPQTDRSDSAKTENMHQWRTRCRVPRRVVGLKYCHVDGHELLLRLP